MIFEPFNMSCRISGKPLSYLILSCTRAPEVTNVCCITLSHEIDTRVYGLLLSHEPFVYFKRARIIVSCATNIFLSSLNLINLVEIVFQILS